MFPIKDFVADFKESGLVERICSRYDIIMIWVSGSAATGITDEQSDYDLGVLVADPITFSKSKKDPEHYVYTANGTRVAVQCVYNSLDDVAAELCLEVLAPYRYLGWAQFKYISDDFIIYKNEKYLDIIEELINSKEIIAENAIYSFLEFWQPKMKLVKSDIYIPLIKWGKMLSHICWCAEELEKLPHDTSRILKLKRSFSRPEFVKNISNNKDLLSYAYTMVMIAQKHLAEDHNSIGIKNMLHNILLKLGRTDLETGLSEEE